jgi:beta-mannosidase
MYPGDESFLENVKQEAIDNYKRISRHPCVALWCGNNEILAAWKRWGWEQTAIKEQSPEIAKRIWKNYDTLFHHILPSVVYDYHPKFGMTRNNYSLDYWASSPSASEGVPEEYTHGDTHYWGVWWGKEPFENFNTNISSFMSEYGFQSFPEYASFNKYAKKQDRSIYSEVMRAHQRSSIGNATIEEYMKRSFRKPIGFEEQLYMSQLLQADGMQVGIEAHRRNKSKCMGSLYWQLNDCWPGASWSSIDYYGKWKALHYKVKESFAPVILSYEFVDEDLQISVVSDLTTPFQGALTITLSEFKGIEKILNWNQVVSLAPNESKVVLTIPKDGLPKAEDQMFTYLQLALNDKKGIRASKNIYFKPFKDLALPCPNLSFEVECDKSNVIYVTISSEHYARGVHVISESNLNFSDNFFDLPINGHKIVSIQLDSFSDIEAIINSIQVKSLWNSMR